MQRFRDSEIIATAQEPIERIELVNSVSLFDLARILEEPVQHLMMLNRVKADHVFAAGSWVILPADAKDRALRSLALLDGMSRISAPTAPNPLSLGQALKQRAKPILSGQSIRPYPSGSLQAPKVKPLSERETALLRQIRSRVDPSWRQYGKCKYDWNGWKKIHDDLRYTTVSCGESKAWRIGVSCKRLMVNIYTEQKGWHGWRQPFGPDSSVLAGEDEMVASLCANVTI